MDTAGETDGIAHVDDDLGSFRYSWSPDGDATGYGVASYIGRNLIVSRLYDLHTGQMLAMVRVPGDYAAMPVVGLMDTMTEIMCQLAEQANVPLSKLTVAVMSGTTAMESRIAGIDPSELQHDLEAGLEEFGRDIEYIMAGPNAIAVGSAYYPPCLANDIGGGFLCSLLAVNVLQADKPVLIINTDPQDDAGMVLAYGNKDMLSICTLPEGTAVEQGMTRFLELCEAELGRIEHALIVGYNDIEVPSQIRDRARRMDSAALEGASAVLLSEMAEDELRRITSACRVVEL